MFDWTSTNAVIGMLLGAVFGNLFPFPRNWWARIQTPVGVAVAACVGWFFFTAR